MKNLKSQRAGSAKTYYILAAVLSSLLLYSMFEVVLSISLNFRWRPLIRLFAYGYSIYGLVMGARFGLCEEVRYAQWIAIFYAVLQMATASFAYIKINEAMEGANVPIIADMTTYVLGSAALLSLLQLVIASLLWLPTVTTFLQEKRHEWGGSF